jgi:hypothetical protein
MPDRPRRDEVRGGFDFNSIRPHNAQDDYVFSPAEQAKQNKTTLKQFSSIAKVHYDFVNPNVYKNKGYLDAETKDSFFVGDFSELFFETYTFFGSKNELTDLSDEETEAIEHVYFDKGARRLVLRIPNDKDADKYIVSCANDLVNAIRKTEVYNVLFDKEYNPSETCTVKTITGYMLHPGGHETIQLEIPALSSLDQVKYENFLDGIEIYVISHRYDGLYQNDTTLFRGIYHLEGEDGNYKLVRHSTRYYLRKNNNV